MKLIERIVNGLKLLVGKKSTACDGNCDGCRKLVEQELAAILSQSATGGSEHA